MKRYTVCISAFIVIILVFTSCTTNNADKLKYKYGIQPPIDKLYWGMTLEDVEATLSISEGVDGVIYTHENSYTRIALPEKIKKFGYEAAVSLEIEDAITDAWFPYKTNYLSYVKLTYTDIDTQQLKKNMAKGLNDSGRDWVGVVNNQCTTWQSNDKIRDLDPDVLNKLKDYWNLLDKHQGGESNYSQAKVSEDSINNLTLTMGYKDSAMVTYQGDTAIPINKVCISSSK